MKISIVLSVMVLASAAALQPQAPTVQAQNSSYAPMPAASAPMAEAPRAMPAAPSDIVVAPPVASPSAEVKPVSYVAAQQTSPAPGAWSANPVVWSANQIYMRSAKNIVAAAEEMPAEKYSYKPTADQWTFGKIVSHIAQSNGGICSAMSGMAAPDAVKVPETASKEALLAGLKASFDFCSKAMDGLTDAKLGDEITFFRGMKVPRARAVMEITADLPDHYSQMAMYLRLNGMLPPSAQPRK
jgi:uncharacterized damage-inducible protein DinB